MLSRDDQMIGKVVSGYTVEELIGAGSFGNVYKVKKENESGTHIAALKHISLPNKEQFNNVLRSMDGNKEATEEYFRNILNDIVTEINTIKKLSQKSNENIITYFDNDIVASSDPVHYDVFIRMEYVNPFLRQPGKVSFSVQDVIEVGIHILRALHICHTNGVIHRDIKDDNLFISTDGNYKIGDFGVSKVLEKSERAKTIKGTIAFIAPEVLSNTEYDETVDLYSLGIVLYKLLNVDRLPLLPPAPEKYAPEDLEDVVERRLKGESLPLPVKAPISLGKVILKACSFRDERYNSANEFLFALEQVKEELTPSQLQTIVLQLPENSLSEKEAPKVARENNSSQPTIVENKNVEEDSDNGNNQQKNIFNTSAEKETGKQEPETPEEESLNLFSTTKENDNKNKGGKIQDNEEIQSYKDNNSQTRTGTLPPVVINHSNKTLPKPIIFLSPVIILGIAVLYYLDILIVIESLPIISTIFNRTIGSLLLLVAFITSLFFVGKEFQARKGNYMHYAELRDNEPYLKVNEISGRLKMLVNGNVKNVEVVKQCLNNIQKLENILKHESDFGYGNLNVLNKEKEIADAIAIMSGNVNSLQKRDMGQTTEIIRQSSLIIELLSQRRKLMRK